MKPALLALVVSAGCASDDGVGVYLSESNFSAQAGQSDDDLSLEAGCTVIEFDGSGPDDPPDEPCTATFRLVTSTGETIEETQHFISYNGNALGGTLSVDGCDVNQTIELPTELPSPPANQMSAFDGISITTVTWESSGEDPTWWKLSAEVTARSRVSCNVPGHDRTVQINVAVELRNIVMTATTVEQRDNVVIFTSAP